MMTSSKLIAVIFTAMAMASCGKEEKPLTPRQIKKRADSIYNNKLQQMKRQAKEDLEKRLPIELKPKVDSILQRKMDEMPIPVFPDDNTGVDDTV